MSKLSSRISTKGEKPVLKPSKFKNAMRLIFVHNIGYKLLALGTATLYWVLAVALS